MKKFIVFLMLLSLLTVTYAQNSSINFEQSFGGTVNGEYWNNAFYGSTSQLSVAFGDLDGDGDFDLIQGSRYRLEWIENIGTNTNFELEDLNWGNIVYSDNEFWSPNLIDIDNDNDLDLFCGKLGGDLSFWENTGNINEPVFGEEVLNYSNIMVNNYASISFCDLDNDLDYDLFIGDNDGVVHYYNNIGTSQIPVFEEQSDLLVETIPNNSVNPEFVDIDNDGDMDLFVGTKLGQIYYYENIGTANNHDFELITENYADINIGWSNLMVTFSDIDNDNDKDMFITNIKGYFYFYENIGDNTEPIWNLATSCFNKILNFGRGSGPASGDIDNDGDNDIVFGDYTILENVGDPSNPEWLFYDQLPNNPDYLFNMPTLVDIDGDNDLDLFYGVNSGYIKYYENIGTPTNPNWTLVTSSYEDIDYGSNTHVSVSFADIDGDSDHDMFVQHRNWDNPNLPNGDLISFYENIGNVNQPIWNLIDENYLDVGNNGISFGRCSFGDIDFDGDFDCLCGDSNPGTFYLFSNTGNSNNPEWEFDGELNDGIGVEGGSSYATPILVDLNNDSYPEIVSGHTSGGMNLWWNETVTSISEGELSSKIKIYPNPVYNNLNIEYPSNNIEEISIHNILGKQIFHSNDIEREIELDFLEKGIYILKIKTVNGMISKKIIKE